MDRIHQHPDFGAVRFQPEHGGKIPPGQLQHFISDVEHRADHLSFHNTNLNQLNGDRKQQKDVHHPFHQRAHYAQLLHLAGGAGIQRFQKFSFELVDLIDRSHVFFAEYIDLRLLYTAGGSRSHSLFLQRHQIIRQSGHLRNHSLLVLCNTDLP